MDQHQQTLRVRGLPPSITNEDLGYWFEQRVKKSSGKSIIQTIGQLCIDENTLTASTTVTFASNSTAKKALALDRQSRAWDETYQIELDHGFNDITVLHRTDNPLSKKPDVDIVALPGLAGHAWNTFSTHEYLDRNRGSTQEINWLRDLLPDLLENAYSTIHYRIMIFGFDAKIWMSNSVSDVRTYGGNLLQYLEIERKDDPERPTLFIGHSLGGLVVKEAISNWARQMMQSVHMQSPCRLAEQITPPVAGCIFFGVPNLGASLADKLSGHLKFLSLFSKINQVNVTDLQVVSLHLMRISSRFRDVRKQCNFPVLSVYETEKLYPGTGLFLSFRPIVDQESAIFKYRGMPQPFGMQANHKEMVKFKHKGEHGLQPISSFLGSNATQAVNKVQAQEHAIQLYQTTNSREGPFTTIEEDPIAILRACHTIFLVDDSSSMMAKWDILMTVLQEGIQKAACYDQNGIDIYLMNNWHLHKLNVKSYSAAWETLQTLSPCGGTPLYQWICLIMENFISDYDKCGKEPHFKDLNLIIITDGDPDEEEESADEISDLDDARRTKGVYRLIRKKIVKVARHLDKTSARRDQLAIQFCQIGDDHEATRFFQYLDDEIKTSYGLRRDMVNTVRCVSLSDITPYFLEKLLIGSLKRGTYKTALPSRSYTGATSPLAAASPTTSSPLMSPIRFSPASPHENAGLGFPVRMPTDQTLVELPHHPLSDSMQESQTPIHASQRCYQDFSSSPRGSPRTLVDLPQHPRSDSTQEPHTPTHASQRYYQDFSSSPRGSPVTSHSSSSSSPGSPAQEQRSETRWLNGLPTPKTPRKKLFLNLFKTRSAENEILNG